MAEICHITKLCDLMKSENVNSQRELLSEYMKRKGLNPYAWSRKAEVSVSIIPNFLKERSNSIGVKSLTRLAKAADDNEILKIFGISSNHIDTTPLDPKRLTLTQEAVEGIIKERDLKLTREQIAEMLAQVYNESLKLELDGEHISANAIARLVINNH